MTLELLCYIPENAVPPSLDSIRDALNTEPGISWGATEGDYCAFHWEDPHTGASCQGDWGDAPLQAEDSVGQFTQDDEKSYPGFNKIGLNFHLPLPVPHWHVIESAAMIERVLMRLPDVLVLNTEDSGHEDEQGDEHSTIPGPLDRPSLLATWEILSYSQRSESSIQRQLDRHSSLALWRYRREITVLQHAHPDWRCPAILVLAGPQHGASVAPWPIDAKPEEAVVLPPADLVLITHPEGAHLISYEDACDCLTLESIPDSIVRVSPAGSRNDQWWSTKESIVISPFSAADDHWLD